MDSSFPRRLIVAALACLEIAGAAQDSTVQLDGTVKVVEESGQHVFRAEVATNLPDDAIVEFDLFYLIQEPSDEDPKVMVWNERAVLGALQNSRVSQGKVHVDLARYTAPPYPLHYLVKLEYDPNIQEVEVRERVMTARRVVRSVKLTYGNPDDFPAVARRRKQEYHQDFVVIEELYKDLNTTFMEYWKDANWRRDRWKLWKESFVSRLEAVTSRNSGRMVLTMVSRDMKGQGAIRALGQELLELLGMCSGLLDRKGELKELPADARENMQRFQRIYEDDFGAMEFEENADPARTKPKLDAVVAAVAVVEGHFKKWRDGSSFDRNAWVKEKDKLQGQVLENLMALSSDVSKMAMYKQLTDVAGAASGVFASCDRAFAGSDKTAAAEIDRQFRSLSSQLSDLFQLLKQ